MGRSSTLGLHYVSNCPCPELCCARYVASRMCERQLRSAAMCARAYRRVWRLYQQFSCTPTVRADWCSTRVRSARQSYERLAGGLAGGCTRDTAIAVQDSTLEGAIDGRRDLATRIKRGCEGRPTGFTKPATLSTVKYCAASLCACTV